MQVRPWRVHPDSGLTAHAVAGRYRLDGLLGRGGAADVYEAVDLRLRRHVAVKVFRGGDARTEEHSDNEGRLLAQLRHPGLVTLFDSGRDEGRPFLVMELVRGTTLRRRLARSALSVTETCRMGVALSSALAHVHGTGIVHRDVKPSNILLDPTGAPRLTDFGISRRFAATDDPAAVPDAASGAAAAPATDGEDTLIGTACYMAPEQALGLTTGPRADVYSLGLVLLESLKGEREYDGRPLEAALARLHRPPRLPDGLPPGLGELLRAMTAHEPSRRPDARPCQQVLAALPIPDACDARHAAQPVAAPGTPARPSGVRRSPGTLPSRRHAQTKAEPAPRALHRPGWLLANSAALAALGVTLTGSIGAAPVGGRSVADPPSSRVTAQQVPDAAQAMTADRPERAAPPAESRVTG
ncbi:serine/threonine protein kinase [Streptomyces venezuelae]|uniref:serine/threonine-protein kinase n=1 Tax=Streptomyces venezuelae TaxID=54571 RepID=UPI00123BEC86|nr:serine/threonine-protein kinase [Streptomyces venezuelae]QES09529.1 serine/threonine protein kinase [Streptomyces venezuelae]